MEIADFYRGRSVLVTGATGFIGKALVEKLLRCCPDVERIYVLVRAKRGDDPQQRLCKLLALPVFVGCPVDKVTAVAGDMALPGLGLGVADLDAVVSNVSVVLHSAATVNFHEPMRLAVRLNVQGAHNVLLLARSMKRLAALVHVSTAYSNCDRSDVDEQVYPPPADVHGMMRRANEEDEQALECATRKLLDRRPNTYTFTKALAENLWAEDATDLPVAIVRPSIVGWAWRDPFPGYVDNINGVVGPFAAIALGTMRSALCKPAAVADVVPVDLVVNTVLAVAWRTATDGPRAGAAPTVYNCVTGASNPVTWAGLLAGWLRALRANTPRRALWHPGCTFTPSLASHRLRTAVLVLASCLHDALARLLGRPATLLQAQRKMTARMEAMGYFGAREWSFADANVRRLGALMSPRDRLLFPVDVTAVDWEAYLRDALAGTKRCLMREEPSTGPRNGLRTLHRVTVVAWWSLVAALIGWLARPSSAVNLALSGLA